jgi:diguanylate cyclase (GGDEF)-like protein
MAIYSLALSGALILLFSAIAYLSMNRVSEPFYKKLAYTDMLTGCENRLAFEQYLLECEANLENEPQITILVFDLNNLKVVNDTQGHKQGDLYLINTAKIIKDNLGDLGRLFRFGGDEFAAVIIGQPEAKIQNLLSAFNNEKRMAVKNQRFSCAVGAATYDKEQDKNLKEVLERADMLMYEEKKRQKTERGETFAIR